MKVTLKNSLAILVGLLVGASINTSVLKLGNSLIPLPEGTDINTVEGLKKAIPLFETRHFIAPFLAHAIGTFIGALLAGSIAQTHKLKFSLAIGVVFLIGGLFMVVQLPAPTWFNLLDSVLAYIPVAYLAGKLVQNRIKKK